jgi:hypothetical protein
VKTVQQTLACILLAAVASLAVYSVLLVRAATGAVAALPNEIQATRSALIGEIAATRADLMQQIAASRRDLLAQTGREADAIRQDVMAEAAAVRTTADQRLGDTLSRVDTALATVDTLRRDLKPSLDNTAAITAQVNDALPLYLDCDHNPDCVFNRYVGASKGVERASLNFGQMSQDVRGALPPMLHTWSQIGVDVSGTAANINRLTKPRWYDRLLGYALNGVVIYRNLNPLTSLTVKGAQILTSRP